MTMAWQPCRRQRAACALAVAIAFLCVAARAGPAPWYSWRSKVDGKLVCAQSSLGPGWEKAAGPFKDSHCGKSIVAK